MGGLIVTFVSQKELSEKRAGVQSSPTGDPSYKQGEKSRNDFLKRKSLHFLSSNLINV